MRFDLDPDLAQICAAVTDFARDKLGTADGFDPDDFRRRWRMAADQGLAATTIPADYGGGGLDAATAAALLEALGYGCPDLGFVFSLAAHQFACLTAIAHFGAEAQRERWLPPLCSGEQIAAHAITEPNAGSDALNLSVRARHEGEHYVLNGIKSFTTNAPVADVFVVQAATSPGAGFFGLSSFLVEAGTPGLSVGRPHGKLGLRGSPMADLYLDECVVPAGQMLGAEGAGASVFSDSMAWERTCLFAAYLGGMKRILESTIAYAREREQFGVPIGDYQAVSHRVVDMTLRYESARLLLYRAAWELDNGGRDEIAPALAKLAVSESAVQLGLDAVQLRGALGVLDGEAEQFLRDALPSRIFSGTNEIQKNNIARALGLGAPRPARRGRP